MREPADRAAKERFRKGFELSEDELDAFAPFVGHPEVWIDNNATERAIRRPLLGRKNYNGCRSPRGMQVAAMLYTIFETAKICTEDPRDYLRRVVEADIHDEGTITMPEVFEEVRDDLT
jgi:transposase